MGGVQRDRLIDAEGSPAVLVVVLHGFLKGPADMHCVVDAVRAEFPGWAIYTPKLPYCCALATDDPAAIAADLLDAIDALVAERGFARIVLIGHSMGSLIARRTLVLAHGEQPGARFEPGLERHSAAKPWAARIDRLVLLAGMARGWSANAAHDWATATAWRVGELFGDIWRGGRYAVLEARLGAAFVVQTRLQWLALMRRPDAPAVTTVQLLGSQDDTVAPEDTIDFSADLASGRFVLVDMPQTDHGNVICLAGDPAAAERGRRFRAAVTWEPDALLASDLAIPSAFVTNGPPAAADPKVTDVVFVIHGIRDKGFWTQKIARKAMAAVAAEPGRIARSMTLSYGYLAMAPFLLGWVRREKVRWLMDRYAECRALYPNAEFHYVGHSNGTYLAARALRDYPAVRFERIVFAGSVVRRDYDWRSVVERGQVKAVLNYVASGDWVVAIFPNGLSGWRRADLGGAGHHGFDALAGGAPERAPSGACIRVTKLGDHASRQIDYVEGGHGAGIKESQWDEIAAFVARGDTPTVADIDYVSRQTGLVRAAAKLPPIAFAAIVAWALVCLADVVLGSARLAGFVTGRFAGTTTISAAAMASVLVGLLALFACVTLVRVVVTRV